MSNRMHVVVNDEPFLVQATPFPHLTDEQPNVAIYCDGVAVFLGEAVLRKSLATIHSLLEQLDKSRRPVEVPEAVLSEVGTQLAAELVKLDAGEAA